jgi:hypothetical protein
VARRRLFFEARDERRELALREEPLVRAVDDVARERLVARHNAQVEERRRRRKILLREPDRLARVEHLVADRERRVPERIEQCLGERRRARRGRRARIDKHHDVRVAAQRHRPAPEAPDRGQRQPTRLVDADRRARLLEPRGHDAIEEPRVVLPEGQPVALPRLDGRSEPCAMPRDGFFQLGCAGSGRGAHARQLSARRRTLTAVYGRVARPLPKRSRFSYSRARSARQFVMKTDASSVHDGIGFARECTRAWGDANSFLVKEACS